MIHIIKDESFTVRTAYAGPPVRAGAARVRAEAELGRCPSRDGDLLLQLPAPRVGE